MALKTTSSTQYKYCYRPVRLKHLITAAAPVLLSLLNATTIYAAGLDQQQWQCQAGTEGQWQCQEQATTAGPYPQQLRPLQAVRKIDNQAKTPQKSLYAEWDWVTKSALKDPNQCDTGCEGSYVEPTPDWPNSDQPPKQSALRAEANSTKTKDQHVILEGDMSISQGSRHVEAITASFNRENKELVVDGDVTIREPGLVIRADQATVNSDTGIGTFTNAAFLHYDSGTRGTGSTISRKTPTTLDLNDSSITQCTPDDETWRLEAEEIHIDQAEGWGLAKRGWLNIYDVPVLYLPYITFPINDSRKSGFLWPSFGGGGDGGFDISTPYYLNLAPNYDATIAPRHISDRGAMAEVELRHLNHFGEWLISGALLNDKTFEENPSLNLSQSELEDIPEREKRWLGSVQHAGLLSDKISSFIDYNKVSDDDYFRDLSVDSLAVKRTTHLNQQASLSYSPTNWLMHLTAQQKQTLDEDLNSQYKLLPRLLIKRNSTGTNFGVEWQFMTELTDFDHDEAIDDGGTFVTGKRTYVEAGASYPMLWRSGFIIPTVKARSIKYDLDSVAVNTDDAPSATTPLATLDMGLIFEREANFGDSGFINTLEPRLYYFYSDFEDDQSSQPDFDTRELTFSYSQLFRDTRFSGHDRLDDANQLSAGLTSRFINNESGLETFSVSLGQIFYFDDRKVQLNTNQPISIEDSSFIASEVEWQPKENTWFTNTLLWNSRNDKVQEGGINVHHQTKNNSLYNVGYRFRRDSDSNLLTGRQDLEQAEASLLLPLSEQWTFYSRFQYDITEQSSIDSMAGLQYEDCCWVLRLLYQEGFDNEYIDALSNKIVVENDYTFIIEFQLKGLGSIGGKATTILRESIFGYDDLN